MEGERKKSMYRKDSEGWLKHTDFMILDMICLQLAYVLAYAISGYGFNPYEKEDHESMVAEDMGDSYNRCSQIADASIEIEGIIKDLSEAELRDEKVLKVVLKKCIESKSDIKSMADGKSLDMLTDKIMELVRDVYL